MAHVFQYRLGSSLLFIFFLVLSFDLLLPLVAQAQVFGEAARTEFFGGVGFRVFYGRINKTQLLMNGEEISAPNSPKVFVNVVPVAVVYGAIPRFSFIAVFPTITRTVERPVSGQRVSDTDFGLGDIALFAKYRFFKKDYYLNSRQVAFQIGLKLPTGADDLKDEQGNRFPQPLQLSSGSVDYRFILLFTEARNRLVFTGDAGYNLKTEANKFEFGDVFNYDFAAKFRVHPSRYTDKYPVNDLYVFLEVNGIVSQKSKINGNDIDDSGGHQLFLSPGIQFFPLENILLEIGIQIPVLQDLNGTQLGTDFNFRTGLRWFIVP